MLRSFAIFAVTLVCLAGSTIRGEVVADGVEYLEFTTPHPNRVFVLKMDCSDPNLMVHMGFPQKRRNFSARESVPTIASRYDSTDYEVVGSVNGSFLNVDEPPRGIHDALGSENFVIQGPGGTRETWFLDDARLPRIILNLRTVSQVLRFEDDSELDIDYFNATRYGNSLAVYTPHWGVSTGTSFEGVEIIISDVNYPMRGDKWVSGVVTAVRTGAASRNNTIAPDSMVISARDAMATQLINKVSVGDRIEARVDINHNAVSSAATMITGRGWLLSNGEINTDNWTRHASHANVLHPRTVVAWNETHIFLVAIDGRRAGVSVGMNFSQMANFLKNTLGATDALNLDGGGSTTMVVDGVVKNQPSDGAPRLVGNSLMIVRQVKPFQEVTDDFTANGRMLAWDEKFRHNPVVPFAPPSPNGDGYALHLKTDGVNIFETARIGNASDTDYSVEADVYLDYREDNPPGEELVGIFARDTGAAFWTYASFGGGNAYAMRYSTKNGTLAMGKLVNGQMTRLTRDIQIVDDGWYNLRVNCVGDEISFYVDNEQVGIATDTTFASGFAGLGISYSNPDYSQARGAYFDNFKTRHAYPASVDDWQLY